VLQAGGAALVAKILTGKKQSHYVKCWWRSPRGEQINREESEQLRHFRNGVP
jgi:hypothetical protein